VADPAGPEAQDHLLIAADDPALHDLAARLGDLASAQGMTIGTAESCTGGLVGHLITAVAGSSAYYLGGVVSYADSTKVGLIGVPAETIERHGAVSAQVAVAMAEGVRERIGCDIAVAVTGVAGPDGGTAAKPVGLTYVATAQAGGQQVQRHQWAGDRAANKRHSAAAALQMLVDELAAAGAPEMPAAPGAGRDTGHDEHAAPSAAE
jgi:PncC family amidohydrolase